MKKMGVKELCASGKHTQMLCVFLRSHLWTGEPPKSGQNVCVDVNATFLWRHPREWAFFPCDFKTRSQFINLTPTVTATQGLEYSH